jgi:RHS repeat-associated protein
VEVAGGLHLPRHPDARRGDPRLPEDAPLPPRPPRHPRLITGNGGAEVSRHTYHPFGEEIAPSATAREKKQFTGHERDSESLDYMHARFYAPFMGRFLSIDPGPSDLRRPQTWNRYVYAENNPVKNVDRDGRLSNPVTGEQGKEKPILYRGGGFGQIRKEQPNVKGSAGGEYGADRAGGRTHKGVDIVAPVGTPLRAAFGGEAYEIRENDKKLGLSVFVRGKGGIIAIYSHLDSTNIKQGDTVKEGEQIGEAGRSGNVMKEQPASEDHVHFQLYGEKGKVTDPEAFLNDPKKQEKYCDPKDKEEKQQ